MEIVLSITIATLPNGLKIGMFPFGNSPPKHGSAYFKVFRKTGNYPDPSATLLLEDLEGEPPFNSGLTEVELKEVVLWAKNNMASLKINWDLCKQGNSPNKIQSSTNSFFKGLWVKSFKILEGFIVEIEFSNGEFRFVDFYPFLEGASGQVGDLIKKNLFSKVKLEDGTLLWPNNVDFDPDSLYEISKSNLQDLKISASLR